MIASMDAWDDDERIEHRKRDRLARLLSVASILYSHGGEDERCVPVADIARLTGMNTRTVYRDLRALDEELGVPIFQAGRGRYGIEKRFFLPPLRLNIQEAIVFFVAARLITQSSDEYDAVVISAFTKLAHALPQPIARQVTATMSSLAERQRNEPFTRAFATVARGWAEGRVVEIEYESSRGTPHRSRVRPYLIEPWAAGRSVYLICHDETAGAMRTYKIERIQQATLSPDRYEIPGDFDADRWLADAWGIWSSDGTAPVEVRLRFAPEVARRVRESIWHRSQRLDELADGGLLLTVQVAGIVEIRPWILGWGDTVEVLEPPELRELVAGTLRSAAGRYGTPERELKYEADDATLAELRDRSALGPLALGPPSTHQERDRYLDTADGRLRSAGWACRLREREGSSTLTLKTLANATPGHGSLHGRTELQGRAAADAPPEAWPPSAARDTLERLRAGSPLVELVAIDQERTERGAAVGGREMGTLSLDRLTVRRDGRDIGSLAVVELELLPEVEAAALVEAQRALDRQPGLRPAVASKLELALGLDPALRVVLESLRGGGPALAAEEVPQEPRSQQGQ
jgi:predicted DNA-binding transcriptional regulator YafY